jgi:AbrB family looped-hinge helix DNA binding protein
MLSVKVSSKFQIAVPSEARRRLGIVAGDRLTVTIEDDELVLRRRPAKASERLWGLGRGLYGPDPVAFVRSVRDQLEEDLGEREAMVHRDTDEVSPADRG